MQMYVGKVNRPYKENGKLIDKWVFMGNGCENKKGFTTWLEHQPRIVNGQLESISWFKTDPKQKFEERRASTITNQPDTFVSAGDKAQELLAQLKELGVSNA